MTGAQKLEEFITAHFSKLGEKNFQNDRYTMRCNYCRPEKELEHRELRRPILQEIGLFSHHWHPKTREMGHRADGH